MAFWGTELEPGKPYVHYFDADEGRLHLSQATLGSGESEGKTIVQCKVGDKKPIYLCSLVPGKVDNYPLNIEFEGDEEVAFSVIGQQTVHLSGFFLGGTEDGGDSDPYEGEAIEMDSESDDSLGSDLEDEDEDDFSDDDDDSMDVYQSSPVPNSGVKIEEILDDEKPTKDEFASKQSKKKKIQKDEPKNSENSGKQLIVRGTSGVPVLESEDEDGFPVSSPSKRKAQDLTSRSSDSARDEHPEKGQKKKGKDDSGLSLKRKIDVVDQDGDVARESDRGADTTGTDPGNDSKQKKKNKKKKTANQDNQDNLNGSASKEAAESQNGVKLPETKKDKENTNKKNSNEKVVPSDAKKPVNDKSLTPSEPGKKAKTKQLQVRSFGNGFVIEELSMGDPSGKKASAGKKIEVYYIGKLKKSGKVFDSNIGRAPFKFRLGIGQVIKGWDVGIDGMRVGDKRRLTIPPSMG
ncbi:OLC1v1027237C3 [Oldenlandia corymbosa var. corymbosa]|nr:OLC1v1027237C3 [Oldenlandia corymbosa var. corymbosa]